MNMRVNRHLASIPGAGPRSDPKRYEPVWTRYLGSIPGDGPRSDPKRAKPDWVSSYLEHGLDGN